MFSTKEEEKERFKKNLFSFLQSRGATNLKVPQIGGKELDLYELYQSVIRKGGAQKVSNSKLWKEIVNEFDLPPSCTSASFTLKNHYQKYLLAYEQKFFFGKNEDEMVRELGNVRQRRPHNDPDKAFKNEIPQNRHIQPDTNLKQNLVNYYEDKRKVSEYMNFIKRSNLLPYSGEMKRVMLAFESRLQEEVRFGLNCMMLHSCSTNSPYFIETNSLLYDEMLSYLEYVMSCVPEVFCKGSQKKMEGLVSEFYINQQVMPGQASKVGPIDALKADKKQMVTMRYDELSKGEIMEQSRIIFQIIRNLICIPQNESFIFKHKKTNQLVLEVFFSCVDTEINRSVLDIVSILCKHILITSIPNKNSKVFCNKIIEYLNSESTEEYDAALECFHNLMLSQENDIIIETMLPELSDAIVRLMFNGNPESVESSLEILCYLSDFKTSTRLYLAKKPNLIPRLLALIAGNISKSVEKTAKLAAAILANLCAPPGAKQCFAPFEKDIFCLAAIDETVSDTLATILLDVEPASPLLFSDSKSFYQRKRQEIESAK